MNRQDSSLRRHVAEGIAIVLSILVAFGIDAAWESRQEGQEEQQILTALVAEFEANRARLETQVAWQQDVQRAILQLLDQAALPAPTLTADSVDHLIAKASWFNSSTTFEMAAVDAVILGGRLSLITDERLRERITGWNREVAFVTRTESQDYDTFFSVWMPFLREHGYLSQINNAITEQPGGEPGYGSTAPIGSTLADHRVLLGDRQFENVLLHRLWVQDDILYSYQELGPELATVITLLTDELDR